MRRGEASITHGHTIGRRRSRTHRAWTNMKTRALNPASGKADSYIDRGIGLCTRWLVFENFLADMGECPAGLTLERKNNNRGYTPDNCEWATKKAQANNRRSSRLLTHNQITQTMAQWAESTGLGTSTIWNRLNNLGCPIERALTQGVRQCQ